MFKYDWPSSIPANSPASALARYMAMYKEAAEKQGYTATAEQVGWAVPTYVGETDARAHAEAKPHIEAFMNKFLRMPPEMLLPPGYLSLQSMKGVLKAKGAMLAGSHTIDGLLDKGMFICGSAETVRQKLAEYQKQIGFGKLLPMLQFATLPHDLTKASMERFAKKVIPAFRGMA